MKLTPEDKLAMKMIDQVNNLTLDLDQVGIVIAQISPSVLFNRLEVIVESAREEKERQYVRDNHNPLW
jgi:hypothetical protein